MKKIIYSLGALSTLAVTSAQGISLPSVPPTVGGNNQSSIGQSLMNIVVQFNQIANVVYGSLFVVALIIFFFGLFKYLAKGSAGEKQEGWKFMGFGVVVLFVMVAIWGLVAFISQSLGIGIGGGVPTPQVPQIRIQQVN